MRIERQVRTWYSLIDSSSLCLFACLLMVFLSARIGSSQNGGPSGGALRTDKVGLPTAINEPPDATMQIRLRQNRVARQNFDAANALRQRQIADETMKLLILARDLKSQLDKTGGQPLPATLLREAEVIEILARDVQQRMILVVGPS